MILAGFALVTYFTTFCALPDDLGLLGFFCSASECNNLPKSEVLAVKEKAIMMTSVSFYTKSV